MLAIVRKWFAELVNNFRDNYFQTRFEDRWECFHLLILLVAIPLAMVFSSPWPLWCMIICITGLSLAAFRLIWVLAHTTVRYIKTI